MAEKNSKVKIQSPKLNNSSKSGKATRSTGSAGSRQASMGSLTMADLMKKSDTKLVKVSKGEILDATITKITSSEILVDIGAKTEAVVLEKDRKILRSLLSSIKLGDKVKVSVLNPESDMGNPVVSLRRFNDNRVWDRLESLKKDKTQIEATVDETTKGGFLISTRDGISGFLPNSQAVFLDNSQGLAGKQIKISIIELNRPLKKVIVSQKATMDTAEFQKAVKDLKPGQKVETVISNIAPFGIFTSINLEENTVEGFVHISEVAWEKSQAVPDIFKQGEKIEAVVLGFDRESKRVNLSVKNLTANPFEEKLKAYLADQKVTGTVTRVLSSGLLVNLAEGIEGFIKKDKIPPTVSFKEGSTINATVVDVDNKKHRVNLAPVLKEKPIGYR